MRRVVPSPLPLSILQSDVIRDLLAAGVIPICAGGGGIPVTRDDDSGWTGVEAVIDKDWTSARLAAELDAELLAMLTDVEAIYRNWGAPDAAPLERLAPAEVEALALPAGSMGPKAAAAAWFAATVGRPAAIGALSRASDVVAGTSGTRIG
jgi:carbamate kinase